MRLPPLRPSLLWLLALLAPVFVACSGGSGDGGAGGSKAGTNLDLVLDTAAESDAHITGRLAVVSLETADGRLTPSLVDAGTEVVLADPFDSFAGLAMRDAPPGTYVAVNLLFHDDFVSALFADGATVMVGLSKRDFRVPFTTPLDLTSGPQSWFTLRHVGPIVFEQTSTGLRWTPTWSAEPSDAELVNAVDVRVRAIDATKFLVDAELLGLGSLVAQLDFTHAQTLLRDDHEVSREEFFRTLKVGELLRIDGWIDSWRTIRVLAAQVMDDDHPGKGPKSEVRGEIVELRPSSQAFVLRVIRIVKDRAGLPVARPLQLVVDVARSTAIKWVPRLGRHNGHLPYEALRVGMLVDVEWFGPAPGLELTAKKVDIHAERRTQGCREVDASIDAIDLAKQELVLVPRGHGRFQLGGASLSSLVVSVDAKTAIVERVRGRTLVHQLAELSTGTRLHAFVCLEGEGRAHAILLRVQ